MSTWVILTKLPGERQIDVNLDLVATIQRSADDTYTRVDYGSWHLDVVEDLDHIHLARRMAEWSGRHPDDE